MEKIEVEQSRYVNYNMSKVKGKDDIRNERIWIGPPEI